MFYDSQVRPIIKGLIGFYDKRICSLGADSVDNTSHFFN